MSHEWYCRCPRCERDALLDTLEDDDAEREADRRYGVRVSDAD